MGDVMKRTLLALTLLAAPAHALTINPVWDSSVTSNPQAAQIQGAVNKAIAYLQGHYFDPITVNIGVGWGVINGSPVTALGQSYTYFNTSNSISTVLASLNKVATSADDAAAIAHFPSAIAPMVIMRAQQKAFGTLGPSSAIDGYVGFSSNYPFTFDDSAGVAPGTYDLYGVALHEMTEVMGRLSTTTYGPSIMDAWRCNGGSWSSAFGGTFSIDGCATTLQTFNSQSGGDAGDWSGADVTDPLNAYDTPGVVKVFSAADLTMMDVIGFNTSNAVTPINGACGSANGVATTTAPTTNLCKAGTPSAVTGTGPWTWSCVGSGGGTTASCGAPLSTATVPAAPTGLTGTASTHGNSGKWSVALRWSQAGVTGDQVWRSVNGGAFALLASISTTSNSGSYTDNAVSHGVTYGYYVIATNAAGASPASATVTVKP